MPPPTPLPAHIYKILSTTPGQPLPQTLPLTDLDAQDGFIHFSTAAQVPATASRFFADTATLWILRISVQKLEEGKGELKWEESRSHGVFAHLYGGGFGKEEVVRVEEVRRGEGEGWEEALKGLSD